MRSTLVCGVFVFLFVSINAQTSEPAVAAKPFNIHPLPEIPEELNADFFQGNRQRLRDTLTNGAFAVLFAAPVRFRTNDIEYPYHQDPDFYYFTGIDAENAMLIVFADEVLVKGKPCKEVLFIEEKEAKKEMWSGTMLSVEDAAEISGVDAVMFNTEFKSIDIDFAAFKKVFANRYLGIERDDVNHAGDLASLVSHFWTKMQRANVNVMIDEGEDLFAFLRQRKQPDEIRMIQTAIDITCQAHNNVMKQIKPGMTEYQLEAIISYTFRYLGASGDAFPSIVASGDNGAIMHYTANDALLIPGDLVVIDIGAMYQGYAADLTRTIPVSGVFTEEQALIYQLVLDAQTVAIRYATKGYKFWTPHEEAYRTIGKGLIKLGIIKEWADIGRYFPHGTSHYLGLDVHDAGVYSSLQPGDLITVEPGIYIPQNSPCDPKWWGIYVRIEDDVLITDGPAKVLSNNSPRTIGEIEAMMAGPLVD